MTSTNGRQKQADLLLRVPPALQSKFRPSRATQRKAVSKSNSKMKQTKSVISLRVL